MESTILSQEELAAIKDEIFSSLHVALPGIVESFDSKNQTVVVQPALRGRGTLPLLRDVPVFFPGSKETAITWPISPGDECLVIFADACIDGWYASGGSPEPPSPRCHDLSDAFAFVGFRSRPNALRDFPTEPSCFGREACP